MTSQASLDRLVDAVGVLSREPRDAAEYDGLVRSGLARLKDAANEDISLDGRIVRILAQQPSCQGARKYWKTLKGRLAREGSQLVTNCYQLKLPADDGRQRLTDVATAETLLRSVRLDVPLVAGTAIFGVGWGLTGICPGPAIVNLARPDAFFVTFVVAMVA